MLWCCPDACSTRRCATHVLKFFQLFFSIMTLRYARLFFRGPTFTARKGIPRLCPQGYSKTLARAPPRRRGQLTILRSSCFPVSVAFLFFIFLKFFRVHVRIFFCTHFRLFDFSIHQNLFLHATRSMVIVRRPQKLRSLFMFLVGPQKQDGIVNLSMCIITQ